jgi:hypothetical protein
VDGGKHGWTVKGLGTRRAAAIGDGARGNVLPTTWRPGGAAINTRRGLPKSAVKLCRRELAAEAFSVQSWCRGWCRGWWKARLDGDGT